MRSSSLFVALAAAVFALPAHATLSAQEILQQFNLVVLGDATSTSHVDGRSFIGGSLSGGSFEQNPGATPASSYAGLTVLGSASGVSVNGNGITVLGSLTGSTINAGAAAVQGSATNDNFNGASYIGGAKSALNQNGGQLAQAAAATSFAAATATNFGTTLASLSQQLSVLSGNSSVSFSNNGSLVTFNANPVNGVAVFDLTQIDTSVFSAAEFAFNLNGAKTVIINSDETTAKISANFLGGSAQSIATETIWNFYDATSVTIGSQFGGSILATGAVLTNTGSIEGGAFVESLNQQAEIHLDSFNGVISAVPEPSDAAYMLAGFALILGIIRRRSK